MDVRKAFDMKWQEDLINHTSFKKKGKEAIEMDVAARKLGGNLQIDMATKNPHISW